MAALGHTVDSGSGASGDYASLSALDAAQQQDLTDGGGDTYTATCITTGDNAADTTAVGLDFNHTTTSPYRVSSVGRAVPAITFLTSCSSSGLPDIKTAYGGFVVNIYSPIILTSARFFRLPSNSP